MTKEHDNNGQQTATEPLRPGAWCGERYAKLLGAEIATEIHNASPDDGYTAEDEESRNWLTDLYGNLRVLDLRDSQKVGAFLKKHFGDRVGTLSEEDLGICAEAFADEIGRLEV